MKHYLYHALACMLLMPMILKAAQKAPQAQSGTKAGAQVRIAHSAGSKPKKSAKNTQRFRMVSIRS